MLKKRLSWHKQQILRTFFIKRELHYHLKRSMLRNYYVEPYCRFMVLCRQQKQLHWMYYFASFQKLYCFRSLSKRVPNKHLLAGRFTLNRSLNYLTHTSYTLS